MSSLKLLEDWCNAVDGLVDALTTIAAQSSGIVGSTTRSDCMAALAEAALKNYREFCIKHYIGMKK